MHSNTSAFFQTFYLACFWYRCLVKWLEVRYVCPMCNKPFTGPAERIVNILDELV